MPHARLYMATALVVAVVATAAAAAVPPPRNDVPAPPPVEGSFIEAPPRPGPSPRPPDLLVGRSASSLTVVRPTPSPTALPSPTPSPWPEWVETRQAVSFAAERELPRRGGRGLRDPREDLVPEGVPLKVLDRQGDRYRVFYGGGEGPEAGEGWVAVADVAPSAAPRWVMARHGTALRSSGGPEGAIASWLQGKAALEVLEDLGSRLRVFYLGDTRTREPREGWVDTSDLAPAGVLLAAETRGARVLSRVDVAAVRSGGGTWIQVPYRTQLDGSPAEDANCGPASVGMVLEYFGRWVPTAELRDVANRLQGTWGDDTGVAIEHLEGTIERHGLRGRDLYVGADFKRWSLEDIRSHLAQGHPVIPQLRFRLMPARSQSTYYEDHYVVITGMVGDDFIYNDAVDSDGPGYGRLMSTETLARAWGRSMFPFAAFAVSR